MGLINIHKIILNNLSKFSILSNLFRFSKFNRMTLQINKILRGPHYIYGKISYKESNQIKIILLLHSTKDLITRNNSNPKMNHNKNNSNNNTNKNFLNNILNHKRMMILMMDKIKDPWDPHMDLIQINKIFLNNLFKLSLLSITNLSRFSKFNRIVWQIDYNLILKK